MQRVLVQTHVAPFIKEAADVDTSLLLRKKTETDFKHPNSVHLTQRLISPADGTAEALFLNTSLRRVVLSAPYITQKSARRDGNIRYLSSDLQICGY